MVRQSFFRELSSDHDRLADLVMRTKIEQDPDALVELAAELDLTFRRHFEVEDRELYPTLLDAVDDWEDRMVLIGAHEDHKVIMLLLDQIEGTPPTNERFRGKIHTIDRLWRHHVEEEEDRLYDMAHHYLDQEAFLALVTRIRRSEAAHAVPRGGADGKADRQKERRIGRQSHD